MSQSGACLFADSELASLPVSVQVPSPSDAVTVTVQLGAAADSYESDLARGERFDPRREERAHVRHVLIHTYLSASSTKQVSFAV